jgi:hypothetical protein
MSLIDWNILELKSMPIDCSFLERQLFPPNTTLKNKKRINARARRKARKLQRKARRNNRR